MPETYSLTTLVPDVVIAGTLVAIGVALFRRELTPVLSGVLMGIGAFTLAGIAGASLVRGDSSFVFGGLIVAAVAATAAAYLSRLVSSTGLVFYCAALFFVAQLQFEFTVDWLSRVNATPMHADEVGAIAPDTFWLSESPRRDLSGSSSTKTLAPFVAPEWTASDPVAVFVHVPPDDQAMWLMRSVSVSGDRSLTGAIANAKSRYSLTLTDPVLVYFQLVPAAAALRTRWMARGISLGAVAFALLYSSSELWSRRRRAWA